MLNITVSSCYFTSETQLFGMDDSLSNYLEDKQKVHGKGKVWKFNEFNKFLQLLLNHNRSENS